MKTIWVALLGLGVIGCDQNFEVLERAGPYTLRENDKSEEYYVYKIDIKQETPLGDNHYSAYFASKEFRDIGHKWDHSDRLEVNLQRECNSF